MKFRVTTNDSAYIEYFTNLLTTISSLSNLAIFKLSKDTMVIIVKDSSVAGGTYVQMDIELSSLFHECVCEGIDPPENDFIILEVTTQQLLSGLRVGSSHSSLNANNSAASGNESRMTNSNFNSSSSSVASLKYAKVKLVKKGIPALLFELEQTSFNGKCRFITHHVPVLIVPPRLWSDVNIPQDPIFDLSIFLPSIKVLKQIIDRIKNLSPYITLVANSNGLLIMKLIKNSEVTVELKFNNLKTKVWSDGAVDKSVDFDNFRQDSDQASCQVEATILLKRFSQFVNSIKIPPNWIVANILNDRIVQFAVEFDYAKYRYNMPSKHED